MLQQPLNHAAAIHVRRHPLRLALNGLDDEGHGLRRHLLHTLLDHVVAVHALDASDDVLAELPGDGQLCLPRHVLDGLLDDAAAVGLARELQKVGHHGIYQGLPLLSRADVEELLDHEVAEDVASLVRGQRQQRGEDHLPLVDAGLVQLLLQEATAVLVLHELQDVGHDVSQRELALAGLLAQLREGGAAVHVGLLRGVLGRRRAVPGALGLQAAPATAPGPAALGLALGLG
mmetsp:Transcript_65387/g.210775  ORF Transcript_65387/g.210775 Transcript_65387/m.210775 type:complete len:232 (-) Transcript_65387:672-1367(-)